ncbi:MAG: hypothetical protein AAB706_03525 [Patescibacteria group bacterium]
MAKPFCLTKELADKLIVAVKEGDVIGDISKLADMTSQTRRDAFARHVDKETAQEINLNFEKAIISKQKDALTQWARRTFNADAKKKGLYKNVIDKIESLDDTGVLTPENADEFLEDLVADRLGASITADEARIIAEKTRALSKTLEKPVTKFGIPDIEYWRARRDLDNYIDSLTPAPALKVFTSVIGRATMLFSFKSPIVNIESNTVNGITEALARRIESLRKNNLFPVGWNNTHAKDYMIFANAIYAKTGYDITRMTTLESAKKRLGEEIIHAQGPGKVRALGRFYTDVVFNKLMTAPDVAFASFHFVDAATLKASIIARSEGLKGETFNKRIEEIFLDATSLSPKTKEGQSVREKAILEAQRGTYTNKTNYADFSLGLRGLFNKASGDLRIGDQLMPFVQVPANVVGTTVDYSGILMPLEIFTRAKNAVNARGRGEADAFINAFDRTFLRKATRAGLGLAVSFIASLWFKPDDFIGEYPITPKERELLKLKRATTNSVRIGNKWVSLDYLGPLGGPLVGFMYAKKYGTTSLSKLLAYGGGIGLQISRTPGFKQFYDIYGSLQSLRPDRATPEDIKEGIFNYLVDFARSRTIPAIVADMAKGLDKYERKTESAVDRFLLSIPKVRETMLEKKLNVFGEYVEGEGFWSSLFAGSRMKTKKEDVVIDELSRLAESGNLPAITDVSRTSPRAKLLEKQIGKEEFRNFYIDFGTSFKEEISEILEDEDYLDAKDDEKADQINSLKKRLFNEKLNEWGYEPPEKE